VKLRGRQLVSDPELAFLVVRSAASSLTVSVLKRVVPLPRLVRFMAASAHVAQRRPAREQKVIRATLIAARLLPPARNCLTRSLVAYRFLCRANARPRLYVGVNRSDSPLAAHAWVTVDGVAVAGDDATEYVPVVAFDERGDLISRSPATV
jgi:hypothetical protein